VPKDNCYKSVKFRRERQVCRVETVEVNLNGRHHLPAVRIWLKREIRGLRLGGTLMKATNVRFELRKSVLD
jgi:predicted secreted Zn-dependent protease